LNFVEKFRETVIENFVSEYRSGRTPNPCVVCNTQMKWEEFLKRAEQLGCDYMATGHYASIERYDKTGRYYIKPGEDQTRDQSYALWGLTQSALSRTLLPLGNIPKAEVRELARGYSVRTAERPESREICFVTDDNYRRFLREWEGKHDREFQPGVIVDESGEEVATHEGVAFFTIGQRKGLGVYRPDPVYVKEIDPVNNRITVSSNQSLNEDEVLVSGVNWMAIDRPSEPLEVKVKIRYLHKAAEATISPQDDGQILVSFKEPQRAMTPGQSAVFYSDEIVLGGGVIERIPE
jgi:tRNA-specific 2-thiouridylase